MRKDILFIVHFPAKLDGTGNGRFLYLAEQLAMAHDVEMATSSYDHTAKAKRAAPLHSYQAKYTYLYEPGYRRNISLQRLFSHLRFAHSLRRYLRGRKRPDVLYCAMPSISCAKVAAAYAKRHGIRLLLDVQDLWPEAFTMAVPAWFPGMGLLARQANAAYRAADQLIAVSDTFAQRAVDARPGAKPPIVAYLGTEKHAFDRAVRENPVQRDGSKIRIAYAGSLSSSYSLAGVLDAMALCREIRPDVPLQLIVMGDGHKQAAYEAHARQLALDVIWHGRVPYGQMCGLLAASDIAVNPIHPASRASIINKHGDYAMAGLPVVSTQQCSEYQQLLSTCACGISCQPGNVQEMANALMLLATDSALRQRMAENARHMGEERFDRRQAYAPILASILE